MASSFRPNEEAITGKAACDPKVVSLDVMAHAHDNNLIDYIVETVVVEGVTACCEFC